MTSKLLQKRMHMIMARGAAVVVGLLIFLVGAEVGARLAFLAIQAYDVEMWRYSRQLKVWGATPGIRFEHRPSATARLMGVDVTTNRHGMRDDEAELEKPEGMTRVVVLGDSITFGWGVPQSMTYPEILEGLLNQSSDRGGATGVEVMNFGVGNYNTVDELAILRHRALAFQPDMILLGVFINDAELAAYNPPAGIWQHSLFAVWLWGRVDALLRSFGWREDYRTYYRQLYLPTSPGFLKMQEALRTMAALCRERRLPLVVALIPELHSPDSVEFEDVYRRLWEVAEDSGLPVVDLRRALPGDVDPRRFWVSPDDSHPNAEAQKLFAEQLYKEVNWKPASNAH